MKPRARFPLSQQAASGMHNGLRRGDWTSYPQGRRRRVQSEKRRCAAVGLGKPCQPFDGVGRA